MMQSIQDFDLWYRLQRYFADNIMPKLANDNQVWAREFRQWLLLQGAVIEHSPERLVRNGLDVAPGFDRLVFQDDRLATVFILRWA
jgi:hypothetical protein